MPPNWKDTIFLPPKKYTTSPTAESISNYVGLVLASTIMLTGYPTHASVEEAMRLGASAYCMKPIDRGELERKVDEVLSKAS